MNYLIAIGTAAVAALYLVIIWECLTHPEW
jgi:hypothetical protein